MRSPVRFGWERILQAVTLLIAFLSTWWSTAPVEGTEFSGGWLTRRLLDLSEFAIAAFLLALLLIYWFPRISAWLTILASLFSLPLLLYFLAPAPFRAVFRGEYVEPLQASVVLSPRTVLPVLAIVSTSAAAGWTLFSFRKSDGWSPEGG